MLMIACSDGSCYDNGSAVPLAWFYASGTSSQVTVSGLTLTAMGVPGDSLLLDGASASEVHLPLRISTNDVHWLFSFAVNDTTMVTDTVSIAYHPYEYFASVECGAMYYFDIDQVNTTHHVIDSVKVCAPHVTHVEQVNLHIYVPTK